VVERFAYEPFGKRRTPMGALDPNNAIVGVTTDRGYTNHEELDAVGLIHMNGRVYDPAIGRFISADPTVPYAADIQSYNRLSYTRNNPLVSIDLNGFEDQPVESAIDRENAGDAATSGCGGAGCYIGSGTSAASRPVVSFEPSVHADSGGITYSPRPVYDVLNTAATIIVPGYGFSQDAYKSFQNNNYFLGTLQYAAAGAEIYLAGQTFGGSAAVLAAIRAENAARAAAKAVAKRVLTKDGTLRTSVTVEKQLADSRSFIKQTDILATIENGFRIPDKQGVAGQYMYLMETSFPRADGNLGYGTIEVLVNELTNTVNHVLYKGWGKK